MDSLKYKHCKPCEAGVSPLNRQQSLKHIDELSGWQLSDDGKSIGKKFRFQDFGATMAFIMQMADIAESQDHHPDFCAGYHYCNVNFTTHAIGGLSENDFICAAKINHLLDVRI